MSDIVVAGKIRDKLKCPICLGQLRDPRVLTCGHTFCFTCIEQDYRELHLTLGKCPVCRESYFVYNRDIKTVRKNFIVNDVLEALPPAGTGRLCQFCLDGDGIFICLKCKLNLCSDCSRRKTNNCCHERILFENLNSKPYLRKIIERSRSKQVCPSHQEEDASFFCQTCKRVLCNSCRLRDHIHHHIEEIHKAVRKLRSKDIHKGLMVKARELDEANEFLLWELSYWPRHTSLKIQDDIQRQQNKYCAIHEEMCHLLQFGSDKTILELYYQQEEDLNVLHKLFDRYLVLPYFLFIVRVSKAYFPNVSPRMLLWILLLVFICFICILCYISWTYALVYVCLYCIALRYSTRMAKFLKKYVNF